MKKSYLLFVFFILFLSIQISADTLSIVIENDFFAGTDKHYTNGIRFGWLGKGIKGEKLETQNNFYSKIVKGWIKAIPFLSVEKDKYYNFGMSLYQMMFTPEDITKKEPNYNDIPYAGHLVLSFLLFEHDSHSYNEFKFQLGIVGPDSGAGAAQKWFHNLIGGVEPQGWDTQLPNHPTFGLVYEHGIRRWEKNYGNGFSSDLIGNISLSLGNFFTGSSVGAMWRIGKNYPKNFNVYYSGMINEGALLGLQTLNRGFGWSVNFGLYLDIIAYLYVIDSAKEYNIDSGYFLGRAVISLSFYFHNFQISVTKQIRSSILSSRRNELSYGAVSILWRI